ncbi:MAG: addiction module antidote protein, HigA family [Candidatus Aminicenantes bacterium RBG_19FT_COMBO_65_30]|nr:MAG: addiction module antidote protein, HigA family [Candidatus Aminicenantes bacterium RBG_19FT_COMBO_65_30]
MNRIPNIHPGEILSEDFLKPMGISAYRLSKGANIDQTRISEIIRGKRSVTADTALRLARFFGNSPEFWLNLQAHYDLEQKKREMEKDLKKIRPFSPIERSPYSATNRPKC